MSERSVLDTIKDITQGSIQAVSDFGDRVVEGLTGIDSRLALKDRFDNDISKYNFESLKFPVDLSSEGLNHFMVININEQSNSTVGPLNPGTGRAGFGGGPTTNGPSRNVDILNSSGFNGPGTNLTIDDPGRNFLNLPGRTTRRISDAIALYIPSPMIYTTTNIYEEISLTAIAAQMGKLMAMPIGQGIASFLNAGLNRSINSGIRGGQAGGGIFDSVGNFIGTAFALAGSPINPRIEVLFSNTTQRQFNFEFLLAPRNAAETQTMNNIIRKLRYHAAPELSTFGGIVPTFIPPSEFDITFYSNGKENTNIPRIDTCLLERVEVDYAPSGAWATFTNGAPVAARLSLAFREIEIVHKRKVTGGF